MAVGPVLITGCSTGIGRATAVRLARKGHIVFATARRPESIADLAGANCRTLQLDVTDEGSMQRAVSAVEAEFGVVAALVNNAGYGQEGAFEDTPMDEVRRQFETNVFGLVRMCQLVLPAMRTKRFGRIVNISSVGGKVTLPGGAFYHATKHAVEALSDVLRFEVANFGVGVSIVEPGLIKTAFGDTAQASIDQDGDSPYREFNAAVAKRVQGAYEGVMGRLAAGPDAVAKAIEHAVTSARPRTRYRVTAGARVVLTTRKLLPDRAYDIVMRTQFPRPKP
jgi:NAD(P)-dependent dehydrogenase (short-subunit alcohol dehydrogenase family)